VDRDALLLEVLFCLDSGELGPESALRKRSSSSASARASPVLFRFSETDKLSMEEEAEGLADREAFSYKGGRVEKEAVQEGLENKVFRER